jgi:hypothetical protein
MNGNMGFHRLSAPTLGNSFQYVYGRVLSILVLLFAINASVAHGQAISIPVSQLDQSARVAGSMIAFQNDPQGVASAALFTSIIMDLQKRNPDVVPTPDQVINLYKETLKQMESDQKFYGSVRNPYSNPTVSSFLNALTTASSITAANLGQPELAAAITMTAVATRTATEASLENDPIFSGGQSLIDSLQGSLEELKNPVLDSPTLSAIFKREDGLAQTDPYWRQIHQGILGSYTKIDPDDTANDVMAKSPELADNAAFLALVGQPHVNGMITISQSQLSALFQQQVAELVSTMETNRSLLLQINATQSNILGYLVNQAELTASQQAQESVRAETARQIQAAGASVYLLSTVLGLGDPKLGHDAYVVGNSAVQMADSLNKLDISDFANTAISSANMVGAVMNVMSLFGNGQSSPDQMILDQIGALREQINGLRLEMHERFDRVDKSLDQIYQTMVLGFDQLNGNVNEVRGALFNLQMDLHRLELEVYTYLNAGFRRDLSEAINGSLDYETTFGQPMSPFGVFQTYENKFYTWAVDNSKDDLESTYGQGYDDASLYDQLTSRPLEANLNYISTFLNQRLGVPVLSVNKLANPRDWAISGRAYVELCRENPLYFRQISTNRLSAIMAVGQQLESSISQLTFTNTLLASGVNRTLWNAAFAYYRTQVQDFAARLVESENSYKLSFPELINVDILHETNFVEVIAGSYAADFGTPPKDGNGDQAYLNTWTSLSTQPDGSILGIDRVASGPSSYNYPIRRVDPLGNVVTLRTIPAFPMLDGTNDTQAIIPTAVAFTPDGSCYIAYQHYNVGRVPSFIAQVETNGDLTTFAGQSAQAGYQDGLRQQALFNKINYIYLDQHQRMYVADTATNSDSGVLRVIDPNGTVSTLGTVAETLFGFSGLVVDAEGAVYFPSFTNSIKRWFNGELTVIPNVAVNQSQLFPSARLALGPNGLLWTTDWSLITDAPGTVFHDRIDNYLTSFDTSGSNSPATLFWNSTARSDGLGAARQVAGGPLSTAWLGLFGGATGNASSCVDQWNNLYICASGSYSPDMNHSYSGRFLTRIGGRRNHQIGVFQKYAADLQTAGNLQASAHKLDGAKELLADLVALSFSQSLDQDDLMRSLLLGNEGLLDSKLAQSLINDQITVLSNAPVRPLLDLPSIASVRMDAFERQIGLHLLEVDSQSSTPTNNLVLHLSITNQAPRDDSSSAHSISILGTPAYEEAGLVSAQSLAGNNINSTITNGFTLGHPSDLMFGTNIDFTISFWVIPDLVTVITGPGFFRPSADGFFFIGNVSDTNSSNPGWWIQLDATGALSAKFQQEDIMTVPPQFGISPGAWMNCTIVFARAAKVVQFYINGINVGQRIINDGLGDLGTGDIIVGGSAVTNYILNGPLRVTFQRPLLNELSIWRRALGSAEVRAMYDSGMAGTGVVASAYGFVASHSPSEPLNIVHSTLDELRLLRTFQSSSIPSLILSQSFNPTNRMLQLTAYGEPGLHYVLESSSNLSNWQTNIPSLKEGAPASVGVSVSSASFFRAIGPE